MDIKAYKFTVINSVASQWGVVYWDEDRLFNDLHHIDDLFTRTRQLVPELKRTMAQVHYIKLPKSGRIVSCLLFRDDHHIGKLKEFEKLPRRPNFVFLDPCFE